MTRPAVTCLFTAEQIHKRIGEMSREVAAKVPPNVMIVALLRGSFVFAADLIRALHHDGIMPQIDFLTVGSYGSATESSGQVILHRNITDEVRGRAVLIIDDILDSGRTLTFARDLLSQLGAASIHSAVLLEKPEKRAVPVQADVVGFTIPDRFVVGYGLDYGNYFRELPFIGTITI